MKEVEFDPQEIEELIGTKKSRKRKRMCPQNNPVSAEKDLSQITCYRCKDLGHYADKCPEKKLKNPRSLHNHKEAPRHVGSYLFSLQGSRTLCY